MAVLDGAITRTTQGYAENLTSRAGADYIIANGTGTYQRKDITTSLFGTPTNNWSFDGANTTPTGYSITGTDGKTAPASFTVTTTNGGFVDTGQYWEVTAPADTDERIIEGFFWGPFGHNFTITATLSDGSAGPLVLDKATDGASTGDGAFYRLRYSAGSASQTVTIRMTATGNGQQNHVGWLWLSDINPIYLKQSASGSADSSATTCSATISAPSAGDLIVTYLSIDKSGGTVTVPSGFTSINSNDNTSVTLAGAYKIASGSEGTLTWSYSTAHYSHMWIGVYGRTASSSVFDVFATANSSNTNVSSQTSGTTAGSATANSIAVAAWAVDSYSSIGSGIVTYTNYYLQRYNGAPGFSTASSSLSIADKPLGISGSTTESTAGFNGGSDQAVGMVAIFKPTASAGAFDINAATGSVATTGVAATLSKNSVTDANTGAYTITGVAATLSRGYTVSANTGAYTITGVASTLSKNSVIDAVTGAYTVSGVAATLAKGFAVDAVTGTYAITGVAATLAKGFVVDAVTGTYAVSGVTATLTKGYVLDASPGSYTINGVVADLAKTSAGAFDIDANTGTYAITGVDATLARTYVLSADPGSYSVSGVAAELSQNAATAYELNAEPGSYTITGYSASLDLEGNGKSGINRVWLARLTAEMNGMVDGELPQENIVAKDNAQKEKIIFIPMGERKPEPPAIEEEKPQFTPPKLKPPSKQAIQDARAELEYLARDIEGEIRGVYKESSQSIDALARKLKKQEDDEEALLLQQAALLLNGYYTD